MSKHIILHLEFFRKKLTSLTGENFSKKLVLQTFKNILLCRESLEENPEAYLNSGQIGHGLNAH